MKLEVACVVALLGACESTRGSTSTSTSSSSSSSEPTKPAAAPADKMDARYVEAIRSAGAAYTKWGRVDELPRQAPTDCAAPSAHPEGQASRVRVSEADAASAAHGEKLYYLWASDRAAYLANRATAVGFAIVKEAFAAVPAAKAAVNQAPAADYGRVPLPIRTTSIDGKQVEIGKPAGLFVMTKVAATDGTDAGWVYGTLAPDGNVTSAGRVTSCIACHVDATHERLFGLR